MKTRNILSYRYAILAFTLFSMLTIISSCSNNNDPGANEVFIKGMAFTPATLTVTAGTTVKWTNKDGVAHTVTSDTGAFDSGNMAGNATFTHTFTTAGTFNYHCTYHSSMTAKVIVN